MNLFKELNCKIKITRWEDDFAKIKSLMETGNDNEEVLEISNKILKIEQNSGVRFVALFFKSMVLYQMEKYEETIDSIDETNKLDLGGEPESVQIDLRGEALRHLGRYQEAIQEYNKVLEKEPNNIDMLMNKAVCLGALDEYREAINSINLILEIEPGNIKAISNKEFILDTLEKEGNFEYLDINVVVRIRKCKIPNSETWLLGEQKKDSNWDIYMVDPQSKCKELFKTDIPTEKFELFFNRVSNK